MPPKKVQTTGRKKALRRHYLKKHPEACKKAKKTYKTCQKLGIHTKKKNGNGKKAKKAAKKYTGKRSKKVQKMIENIVPGIVQQVLSHIKENTPRPMSQAIPEPIFRAPAAAPIPTPRVISSRKAQYPLMRRRGEQRRATFQPREWRPTLDEPFAPLYDDEY